MNMDSFAPGNGKPCPTPQEVFEYISAKNERALAQFGSFSSAIYDTAWLSMVDKPDGSSRFPQCFEHLLNTQNNEGTWTSYGSQIDGVLNTLASLLAMVERLKKSLADPKESLLHARINKARDGVQALLQNWDVNKTVHVGFEILVTSLIQRLEVHDITFDYPGQAKLIAIYNVKMAKFTPMMVYAPVQSTILHSVEALVGKIDFNKLKHHCTESYGIMGSPSATAAYLINSTEWDDRAENYLERVFNVYGKTGEVPSAFPTSIFELSWALSNLLPETGLGAELSSRDIAHLTSFFDRAVAAQGGVVGFAPGLLPDADDTARTLMTLKALGTPIEPGHLVAKFENGGYFRTYELERNPSISANCNVLLALLEIESVDEYLSQITNILTFLLREWNSGEIHDKWNISAQYTSMLMIDLFVRILKKYNDGHLRDLSSTFLQKQIPEAICQILLQTLGAQESNGSWSTSLEETAYSIFIIKRCQQLPFAEDLMCQLESVVASAQLFIKTTYPNDQSNHYFWVEKTTYQSHFLKVTYCSMAMYTKDPDLSHRWNSTVTSSFHIPEAYRNKLRKVLHALPIFQKSPIGSLDLVLLEAMHAAKGLKEARHSIMERNLIGFTKDEYLEYIPVIWMACNQINGRPLGIQTIRHMLLLSMFNCQIDEYMESVVAKLPEEELVHLRTSVQSECGLKPHPSTLDEDFDTDIEIESPSKRRKISRAMNQVQTPTSASDSSYDENHERTGTPSSLKAIISVIRNYVSYALQHPLIVRAPFWAQRSLAVDLHDYLIGQINHNRDNRTFASVKANTSRTSFISPEIAQSTYWKWVNTTGANDTSCPFSWLFFVCLISEADKTCLDRMPARYLGESFIRHLSVLCRQYNDFGSVRRDAKENNLNSIDFAEFGIDPKRLDRDKPGSDRSGTVALEQAKTNLIAIAEFEKTQMNSALDMLYTAIDNQDITKKIQVFVDVTDTFGQVYVLKDISSQNQSKSHENH